MPPKWENVIGETAAASLGPRIPNSLPTKFYQISAISLLLQIFDQIFANIFANLRPRIPGKLAEPWFSQMYQNFWTFKGWELKAACYIRIRRVIMLVSPAPVQPILKYNDFLFVCGIFLYVCGIFYMSADFFYMSVEHSKTEICPTDKLFMLPVPNSI